MVLSAQVRESPLGENEELIGETLDGRYKITAHLFGGRFGDFWTAKRLSDGGEVAIKYLKPDMFDDDTALARFERETKLLTDWRHPNLLRVLDIGRTPQGAPWLVTRLVRGRPLYHEIANQEASVRMVCHMAAQIARVLAGAHARGIIHRGLSPDSIMLVQERGDPYRVKVLDFGLAKMSMGETDGDAALTKVGQRLGQPEYMAPEYIEEFKLNAKTDIYALGILFFEMLVGQAPFVGNSRRILLKHMEEEPIPVSSISMHEIPEWLDELIACMLEKEPDKRPESAMAVAKTIMANR